MKKVLSWVLTLALVLGSFSMAFAADTANSSSMSDAATINNVEAVDVMVATGIIEGYPDGTFQPEKVVTRAQMAKMITIAKNGGEDVGDYYKASCTFADSVNHWAAGYIGYCANQGIIDGRSESVFDPDGTVTGVEAAKMLLIALGYDSKIEGYTGSQWSAKVLKDAKENDLFDGCDNFKSDASLTRDNAAQMILNAFNAEMVEYDYDAEIKVGDTLVSVNTKCSTVVDSKGKAVSLYQKAFDGDLKKIDEEDDMPYMDDFGRYAHKWTLEGDKIGTYADEADFSFAAEDTTLDEAIEAYDEDFYDDYGSEWTIKEVYYNGAKVTAENNYAPQLGDVIEFFDVTDGEDLDQYRIVISHYDFAKITKVKTKVTDKEAKKGINAKLSIVGIDGTKYGTNGITNDKDLPGYDAATYVEDAILAVAESYGTNKAADTIIDSFIPEKKTGEVTKVYSEGTSIAIDGDKIETVYGKYIKAFKAQDSEETTTIVKENEYDFYLVNGYILGAVDVTETVDNYGIYLKAKNDGDEDDLAWTIKLINADGETVTLDVDEDKYTAFNSDNQTSGLVKYDLIKYDLNDDNEIKAVTKIAKISDSENNSVSVGAKNTKFDGYKVSEDVVIFADNNENANDRDFTVCGFDSLEDDATLDAYYLTNADNEIVAMCVLEGLGDVEKVYGLFEANDNGDITLWGVDGELNYTVGDDFYSAYGNFGNSPIVAKGTLCVATINSDGEIKAIKPATLEDETDTKDSFGAGIDAIIYNSLDGYRFSDSEDLWLDEEIDVTDATIYYLDDSGEFTETSDIEGDFGTGTAYIYQIDKAGDAWNLVFLAK